jgi:hypothetical protein
VYFQCGCMHTQSLHWQIVWDQRCKLLTIWGILACRNCQPNFTIEENFCKKRTATLSGDLLVSLRLSEIIRERWKGKSLLGTQSSNLKQCGSLRTNTTSAKSTSKFQSTCLAIWLEW